jgi:hypothetical protein
MLDIGHYVRYIWYRIYDLSEGGYTVVSKLFLLIVVTGFQLCFTLRIAEDECQLRFPISFSGDYAIPSVSIWQRRRKCSHRDEKSPPPLRLETDQLPYRSVKVSNTKFPDTATNTVIGVAGLIYIYIYIYIFSDITPCNPLEPPDMAEFLFFQPSSPWFLAWLIFLHWRWRLYVRPKRLFTINGLHTCISHKTEPFMVTAIKTSNPTWFNLYCFTTCLDYCQLVVTIWKRK